MVGIGSLRLCLLHFKVESIQSLFPRLLVGVGSIVTIVLVSCPTKPRQRKVAEQPASVTRCQRLARKPVGHAMSLQQHCDAATTARTSSSRKNSWFSMYRLLSRQPYRFSVEFARITPPSNLVEQVQRGVSSEHINAWPQLDYTRDVLSNIDARRWHIRKRRHKV